MEKFKFFYPIWIEILKHIKIIYNKIVCILNTAICFKIFDAVYEDKNTKLPTFFSMPLLGHIYLFSPGGKYSFDRFTEAIIDITRRLGNRFILKLGGVNMFITSEPNDAQHLFRVDGKYPERPTFEALIHYRKKYFKSVGCVPGNGEEWYHYRQGMMPLLKMSIYQKYKDKHVSVASAFVKYIEQHKNKEGILEDILTHLMKYTIDAIAVTCPGTEFNCLLQDSKEADRIIKASNDFMDGLYATMGGFPTWKFFETKGYKQIKSAHQVIYSVMSEHIHQLRSDYDLDPESVKETNPFMYTLLSSDNFSWADKIILAMEIFFGGIDATATAIAITLHYLSHNSVAQEKAREEALENNDNYIKACVKEALRLNPTSGGTARFLPRDTNFDDYMIPKGTLVIAFASVASLSPRNYKNPMQYEPERWLSNYSPNAHKFASLPFGHGARMCPGRKLAMQEITVVLQEILKHYHLQGVGSPDVGMIYRMNRIPDRKICIKFTELKHQI